MLNKLMIGRLGNQMFQYATVRAEQINKYSNDKINLNFSLVYQEGEKSEGFFNQLDSFNISDCCIDQKINLNFMQKFYFLKYIIGYKLIKIFNKNNYELKKRNYEIKIQKFYQKYGLFFFNYGYYKFSTCKLKNKFYVGFYESAKYFNNIKDILKIEFTPKYPERKENIELYEAIRNTESICISIRRGDFLRSDHIKYNYVCTPEYFINAINIMQSKIINPKFIVFSDDIEWVKNNIKFPINTLFESGTDPVWEKLRLMYECKHFIISNSTFSWWAQYLSRNEKNKIVIAPKKWKNEGYNDDIYEENWIRI